MNRAVAYAVASAAFATLVCGVARRLDSLPPGLTARYTAGSRAPDPSRSLLTTVEGPPWLTRLPEAWRGTQSQPFAATWSGLIAVPYDDTYVLAITADAGASLYVDGQPVFDQVARADARFGWGEIHLTRGAHAVFIEYAHLNGPPQFDFFWARHGAPPRSVPAWALRPRRVGTARLLVSLLLSASVPALAWVWAVVLVGVGITAGVAAARWARRILEHAGVWRELRWILAGSLVLTLLGIWWGLPEVWVPIELTPTAVADGWSRHYSHGWFDAYPPFHYYVLTAAISPVLTLREFAGVDLNTVAVYTTAILILRLVSAAASTGVVAAACLAGSRAFGRRAGLLASAAFALTTPFLYYAKTANVDVPYLFWFAVSIVFYLRMLDSLRLPDFILFAGAATLAVCTKDQAYGLYLLVPVVVVERMWRVNREDGRPWPFLRVFADLRIVAAVVTAAVLFAASHNFLFNFGGFVAHVRLIVGPASESYRVFESNAAGRWALFRLTIYLIRVSTGWPLFLVGTAGTALALMSPGVRRVSIWLIAPVVSYYLGFINVILYNYDRFVLPVCFVLAIFGGFAIDAVLTRSRGSRWVLAVVAASFVYTFFYASTVDVLMVGDSRYEVRRWMTANIASNDLIGISENPELLPRLEGFRAKNISSIAELRNARPRYFILNSDYARAAEPGAWGDLLRGLEQGTLEYHVRSRFRRPSPWPWLPGAHPDLVGRREEVVVFSVLRDINPLIEVFEREGP